MLRFNIHPETGLDHSLGADRPHRGHDHSALGQDVPQRFFLPYLGGYGQEIANLGLAGESEGVDLAVFEGVDQTKYGRDVFRQTPEIQRDLTHGRAAFFQGSGEQGVGSAVSLHRHFFTVQVDLLDGGQKVGGGERLWGHVIDADLVTAQNGGGLWAAGDHGGGGQSVQNLLLSALRRRAVEQRLGAHAGLEDHHLHLAGADVLHQLPHLGCVAQVNFLQHRGRVGDPAVALDQGPHLREHAGLDVGDGFSRQRS